MVSGLDQLLRYCLSEVYCFVDKVQTMYYNGYTVICYYFINRVDCHNIVSYNYIVLPHVDTDTYVVEFFMVLHFILLVLKA